MQLQYPLSCHSPQGPPINGQMVKLLKMPEAKRWKKKLASGVLSVKPNRMHIPEFSSLKSSLNSDNSFGHFLKILLLKTRELSFSTLHMNSFKRLPMRDKKIFEEFINSSVLYFFIVVLTD